MFPSSFYDTAHASIYTVFLLHHHGSTNLLHGGNNLLSILLRHILLHHLGCALDELLAVDQAEAEQTLDLLDDLGLGCRLDALQLQGEEMLLSSSRRSFLGLLSGGRSSRGSGEATNGEIGDVELVLQKELVELDLKTASKFMCKGRWAYLEGRHKVCSLEQR